MNVTAKLLDAKQMFYPPKNTQVLTISVYDLKSDGVIESLQPLLDKECEVSVKRKVEKRSLDSNAYFHKLCDELRKVMKISLIRMKHILICDYGQALYIGDEMQYLHSSLPVDYIMENEFPFHMDYIGEDDDGLNIYRLYRGSHTYNTAEMSQLIEGTIAECKEQGIETATPDELAKMAALWEKKRGDTGVN